VLSSSSDHSVSKNSQSTTYTWIHANLQTLDGVNNYTKIPTAQFKKKIQYREFGGDQKRRLRAGDKWKSAAYTHGCGKFADWWTGVNRLWERNTCPSKGGSASGQVRVRPTRHKASLQCCAVAVSQAYGRQQRRIWHPQSAIPHNRIKSGLCLHYLPFAIHYSHCFHTS